MLKFLPLASHKGKNMADLVLEVLNKSDIDVSNCRGQSYDNVSSMSGTYKGMQTEIKRQCKYADYCLCVAHSLKLVGESAASCCIESAIFFFFFFFFDYQ